MAYTRATLVADLQAYLHRTDLPLDTFIDQTNVRVGQDFRTIDNKLGATVVGVAGLFALPTDFKEMIVVTASGPNGAYEVPAASHATIINYFNSTVSPYPFAYQVSGYYLNFTPSQSTGSFGVNYYAALALGTGAATNSLLTAYYNAYLFYALMLANLFIQNPEAAERYLLLYVDEKDRANAVKDKRVQPITNVMPSTFIAHVAT